ncbi:MAG: electron transport complex subunit RsxC [Barnesiella sp.]|nr:electron transport complex subunit RsxC [Barnesiella sp.]MBD5344503.1 electron transport complex subunit RsxC [Bacteroides sp.]
MKTFKIGGIHPGEFKPAAGKAVKTIDLPLEVVVPLSQHIGAPAVAKVAKGDHVERGQIIAEAGGFVSANVHAPISGTVVKIDKYKTPQGLPADAIFIKADEADHAADTEKRANPEVKRTKADVDALGAKEIVDIIKGAGIVGMGGATFPTHVKLCPPPGNVAEVLIINAVECEPYLSCDDMLMRERAEEVLTGVQLLMRAANVNRAIIAIEENKPEAIAIISEAAKDMPGVEVMTMKMKYPQGSEKQLIEATIGKEVPSGGLPIATGAIVQNVATASAVARAVIYDEPLIERMLTLINTADGTAENYLVAVGTPMASLLAEDAALPAKIILGGPMMGRPGISLQSPVIKGTSGILLLDENQASRLEPEPCIRCGKCVEACPMGLEPFLLSTLSRLKDFESALEEKVVNCIECGCCSFSCPANRPILDYIRIGKSAGMGIIRARAAAAKK